MKLVLLTVVWALASQASAQRADRPQIQLGEIARGYVYYNRSGATDADHNTALGECIRDTSMQTGPSGQGLIFDMIWSGPIAGLGAARVENCMIVHGWRVFRAPDAEGAAMARLTGPTFIAQVSPWIGSATPPGTLVREWTNDAAHPAAYQLASRPAAPGDSHLSLKFYRESGAPAAPADSSLSEDNATRPLAHLRMPNLPLPRDGMALIVVRVKGISNRYGTGVSFSQALPPRAGTPALFYASIGFLFAKREGNWFAIEVPAGRWRIAGSGFLNYCLGSPSFEAVPGAVVYAGTFDLAGQEFGPDLSMGAPEVQVQGPAAARLEPAVYQNGSRASCHVPQVVYALEIPGVPFAPDYELGSALNSR